jgi:hypothetical protein
VISRRLASISHPKGMSSGINASSATKSLSFTQLSGFVALIEDVKLPVSSLKFVDLTLEGADQSFESAAEAPGEPIIT